ncbi:hypoxanthine phosphoribosyltransferase, partial [Enterococcus faecium]
KGAVLFTTDIIREMDIYADLDFINLSSYGNETISSGEVQLTKDLDADVTGRDVLVIEDIIDTGRTLKFLIDLLKRRDVNSVK